MKRIRYITACFLLAFCIILGAGCETFADTNTTEPYSDTSQTESETASESEVINPSIKKSYLIFNMYDSYKDIYTGYYVNSSYYVPIKGVTENTNIVVKTSSRAIRLIDSYSVNEDGERLLYIEAKKSGTYNVTIKVGNKTFKRKIYVKSIYFRRSTKTLCDAKSKKWIPARSMICLYKGESIILKTIGIGRTDKIVWTSDNKDVVTVDKNGKIKAVSMGYANITATYGNVSITYKVAATYKEAAQALRYAYVHLGDTYSQAQRMEEGKYDCSSYAWRSYDSAGMNVGNLTNWAPTAADIAKWCIDNGYMIMMGNVNVEDMLPGDLVFWGGQDNGRYYGIYHVDIYEGNNTIITVESESGIYSGANALVARPCEKNNTAIKKIKPYVNILSVRNTLIKFNFTHFCGVDGYKIYRKTGKGKYRLIKTIKGAKKASFTDKGLDKNKTYKYKVKAYKVVNGKTIYSKISEEIIK